MKQQVKGFAGLLAFRAGGIPCEIESPRGKMRTRNASQGSAMIYFYVLDSRSFFESIRPALSASWQQRSFLPCRELCRSLVLRAKDFFAGHQLSSEEPLLRKVARGLAFDRRFWHHLVGEVLMFSAALVPEIQTAPETLCCLLAPDMFREGACTRARFAPIQQAHFGSRDLVFGGSYYRPEFAGWHDPDDVVRLHDYLSAQKPDQWTTADLEMMPGLCSDAERAEELAYAREWFGPLCGLYRGACDRNQIIVCEVLGE